MADTQKKKTFTQRLIEKATAIAQYCWTGVWKSQKDNIGTRLLKTLNLSIRSFLDRGLQWKSMALTYTTVLAIVPALALLLAIGRGFGFQNLLQTSLYQYFPSQSKAITTGLSFVDSYLEQASSGLFVGIGIIVLLWTLISLLSSIEESFNYIWDIKRNRGFFQQITDYIAICLIVPVLMICSSGVSIFMSAIIQDSTKDTIFSPLVNIMLEASPVVLAWLAFSLSYCLIPNTKVQFRYAAIAGAVCAVAFQVLQLLFVNGQLYVSKYNAIYGSFSFLPLLLVWLQLSWLILLFGCVLTYSLQNVFAFNFLGDLSEVADNYMKRVTLVIMTVIVHRFLDGKKPMTANELSLAYDMPIRLVNRICESLYRAGLLYRVMDKGQDIAFTPAVNADTITVGEIFRRLDNIGDSDFIPQFNIHYASLMKKADILLEEAYAAADKVTLSSLKAPQQCGEGPQK